MLSDLFGTSSIVRVLDFVLEDWDVDFSATDIARETGLTWKSVAEAIPALKVTGLIVESRRIAKAKLYKVNRKSPLFQELYKIDLEIASAMAGKYAKETELKHALRVRAKRLHSS